LLANEGILMVSLEWAKLDPFQVIMQLTVLKLHILILTCRIHQLQI
jgi:hypothetical protein